MATVKNVGLSPINIGDAKKYTAMQSPSYKEEFWQKMRETNDTDYYLSLLNQADKKGLKIDDIDFTNLDDVDDQWAAFYMEAAADNTTKTDYGKLGDEELGELTEKEYLGKILDKKREYNVWVKQEAEIAAQKEAMSGWDKFWNGVGAWSKELGYSLEQIPLSLLDFVTNWDGGDSVGFIEDWRQDTIRRQQELADYERKYTNLRDVETWDPTFVGQLAMGSAQTLGLMIPAMLSNFAVPGSGFYVMYGSMFVENVYEARHNPNVEATQVEIILRAFLMTAAEAAVEKWLGSSLLDDVVLNGKRFGTEMVKVTTLEGLKILGKDILHEAVEEGLQEIASNLVNMTLSLGNSTWDQYIPENLANDVGMAALMGAIFAAGNITIGGLMNDIKSGRIIRNITRKFQAGDIISNYNTKTKTKGNTKVDTKVDTKTDGYHATNFFERIALNANFHTFQENLKLAKEGKLTMDQKQLLYNQTMALGAIFSKSDTAQIQRSMELLNQLESYIKQEGVKEETIKKADNLYLESLMVNLKSVQSEAAAKFWGNKISEKEAARLAKEARISKTNRVIDKKTLDNETKKIDDNPKDTKKKQRKKVVKTLIDEGKSIVTTDGQSIELIEDTVFVPEKYMDEGDPNFIIKSSIEKDMAQEFVQYMKSPKRLVGWSQAKAALIKAYPEMADYNDIQIARNLLFNPGGPSALISVLPNSEFNILFLNMLDGLKQVAYKTEVAKAVKQKTIEALENNFRYAARMFCANNLGVNPHDLHNVLTKADQIFIKTERAKAEAKINEVARANSKIYSKQMFHDIGDSYNQDTPLNQMNSNHEMVYGVESLSYDEYIDLFRKGNSETKKALEEAIKKEPSKFSGWDDSEGVIIPVKFNRDVLLYRGLATVNDNEGKYQTVLNQMVNARPGDVIDIGKNVSLSADALTSQGFEGDIMLRLIFPKGQKANTYYTGSFVNSKNAKQAMKKLLEDPWSDYVSDNISGETYPEFEFLIDNNTKGVVLDHSRYNVLGPSQEKPFQISHVITLDLRPDSAEKVKNHTPIKLDIKEAYKEASEKGSDLLLYSGTLERKIGGINTFTDRAAFETLYGSLLRIKEFKEDIGRWTLGEDLNKQRKEKAEKLEKFRQEGFQVDEDKDHKLFYITPPKPLWVTSEIAEANAYGPGKDVDGDRTVQWGIEVLKDAPTEGVTFYEGNSSLTFDQVPIAIVDIKTDDKGNIFVRGRVGGEDYYTNRNSNKNLTQEEKLRKIFGGYETKENSPNEDLLKLPEDERLKRIFNNSENQRPRQEFHKRDLNQGEASFTTPEYENETYKYMQDEFLKDNLSTLEKSNLTLKEVINNPESYLKQDIIDYILNNFGDLSKQSVYMGLRSYLIGETDGTKTITVSENGDRYYFADVTNVKKWNTPEFNRIGNEDPKGRSLFEKYDGKTVNAREFWRGDALIGSAANVEVEFKKGGGTYYSDEQNKIYFDTNSKFITNNLEFLFALNHEFQHALQGTNRTAKGFALGLNLPTELIAEVKSEFPEYFKKGMTPEEERKVANDIIYEFSGEKEADQHAIEEEYYPFIVAIKGDKYAIFTPSGKGPYFVDFARTNKAESDSSIINKTIFRGTSENTFDGNHLMTYFTSSETNAKHYTGETGKVDRYSFKANKADVKTIDFGGYSWDMFNDGFFRFDEETGKVEFEEGIKPNRELKKAITGIYKDLNKIKTKEITKPNTPVEISYEGNPPEVKACLDKMASLIKNDKYNSLRGLKTDEKTIKEMKPLLDYLGLKTDAYSLLYAAYLVDFFETERLSTESILLKYKMTYPDLKAIIFENIEDPEIGDHYVIFKEAMTKEYITNRTNLNKRLIDQNLYETTNLKYFKRKGKKIRLHPDVQTFVINAKDLNKVDEWVAIRIKDGSLNYRNFMKWFKETPNINEYTFKNMREAFWPNSPIHTFEELSKIALSLTYEIDSKGNFKEVKYRFEGKEFVVNEESYRASIMEHWEGPADIKKMRRIVGATEIMKRTSTFTEVENKIKSSANDSDMEVILGVTEDFADAVLNDTSRTKKAERLREIIVKKVAAKAIAKEWDYNKSKAYLDKYTVDYFEELPDEQLNKLYLKEVMKKAELKTNEAIIEKAINRNRKNAVANIKRLGSTIWNNTTPKNRQRLPEDIKEMFDKDGQIKTEVFKGKPIAEVSGVEERLKEIALKARRGDYSSTEVEKAYASLEKTRKEVEKLKKKAKTQIINTTKVVTEYKTDIKTEAKIIQVQTTKKNTPSKLEQLLSTNFTKKRMSNMQEMTNYEYFVSERKVFQKQNQEILDSISEAEWIDIVEWFEQSELVGTETDLGTFKAIRMFILSDLVSRIKTHNIVLDNTWLNRVNNIMSSNVHSSAVEMATYGKVLNSINPYRQLAEQYNVSEETLDTIQDALESDNDEELAKAIDELKLEIAENYVEKNMMEKIMAFRYTAMLSGPVTWLRNLISNFIVKHFNKAAATIGEKLGGKRLSNYKGYKLVGTKVRSDVAEFIKVNLLDTGLLHQLTEGYSKYDPYTAETANKIDKDYIVRTMVNNFAKKFEADNAYGTGKKAQLFNKFSSFVRKMISDDKFVNEATLRYFGKMLTEDIESGRMDVNKLREGIFNKEIVEKFAEAQWLAMGDYMKNTNFMTKAISALNESKWARYIMPLIMPFAQSSWNWWIETMRYSPFGLAQSVVQLLRYEKYVLNMEEKRNSSKKGQSASVQGAMLDKYMTLRNLGKGVIGTSLWTLGIILGAAGVVGISKNDDDKYVIKIGNLEINVDNIFGSSTFLAGAALVGAIKDGRWMEMFNVTIDQMARTLFVTDLISSFRFQTIGDYVAELPLNILYSFVPNFIKMLSTNLQVYKVKYDKGILGDLERIAAGIIPGLSYAFPKEIDPFTGKPRFHRIPILTQAGGISYNDISEAERAAIAVGVGAGQLTGELTVKGQKYQLDREKVNVYRGEFTNQFMTDLLNDQYLYEGKKYSRMSKEERAKAIKSILDKSAEYAKIKVWTEMGNKYYASKDLYFTLKNLGINNVYQGSGGYIKK